jgi:biopolymer transport protein TolR
MGMSVGGKGQKAEINVTPMIDVLLVLIIIFLVITPTNYKGLKAVAPQEAIDAPPPDKPQEIVITVAKDGSIAINQQAVEFEKLGERLLALRGVSDHVFVKGDGKLEYHAVAEVIDAAHNAGWERVGLMTK